MPTKVVAIANQKGGVGKTTTVVNLAACLAELKQNVLVLDFDPQSNATSGLGLPKQEGTSIYKVLMGESEALNLIQQSAIKGVDIIPSELDLAGAEVEVARMENYLHCLSKALAPVTASGKYDVILIDCPPSLGILTMNALAAADSLLVPMQCEYYAMEGLSVINALVKKLRENGINPNLEIEGILMTMYSHVNLASAVIEEVKSHFGDFVYDTVIPRNVRLSEAPSHGQPVTMYDPYSAGTRSYRLLAEEFLARMLHKE